MARKQKSLKDLADQRWRIERASWDAKTQRAAALSKRADKIFDTYSKNIDKALGYDTYYGMAQYNIIDRHTGRSTGTKIEPIMTKAKSKEHAEQKLKGDRFTWQNGEKYLTGTAKKGDPFKELNKKRVHSLDNGIFGADEVKKLDRSAYTGKSDATYKAESDRRHAAEADWKKPKTMSVAEKRSAYRNMRRSKGLVAG